MNESWEEVFRGRRRGDLEEALARFLPTRRWFGGKARRIHTVSIADDVRVSGSDSVTHFLLLEVEYRDHSLETYAVPLTFASGETSRQVRTNAAGAVMATIRLANGAEGVLYDALWGPEFTGMLLETFLNRRAYPGEHGELISSTTDALAAILGGSGEVPPARVSKAEQSNTSVFYGDELILKLFRRPEAGTNPDLEIGRFLTEKAHFPHIPPVAGAIEYQRSREEPVSIAILQGYVANEGDAWSYTLDTLSRYYEEGMARSREMHEEEELAAPRAHPLDGLGQSPPTVLRELVVLYLERAALLGQRTGELHLALASEYDDPAFRPEAFTDFYRRSQYQSMRGTAVRAFGQLRERLDALDDTVREQAARVLALEGPVRQRFAAMKDRSFTSHRIRIHGDYHLGQVLYTGKDFVIIDFEGEPARSLSERRGKTSALRDVAGMVRSFHYASFASQFQAAENALPHERADLERWRLLWYHWVSLGFLESYLDVAREAPFLPARNSSDELRGLLDVYLLEKAVYELGYELNNRPDWVRIPLEGILQVMEMGEQLPGDSPSKGPPS